MSFDDRIRELIAHAYAKAPTIRQIMDERHLTPVDIQSAADLPKLPVMPKDRLIELQQQNPPFGGLLTIAVDDLPRIYISPGPIYDPQPPSDDPEGLLAPFRMAGFGKGDRVFNTFMYHLTPAGLLLDEALRALGATVVPTGPGNTELQVMMMNALKVTGYVGTPSFLAIILDKAAELGIPQSAVTIKKALFSAEPYTPSQRVRFEGEYGMTTVSAYGTADLGLFGYTAPGVQGFCVTTSVYVEVVDPESGQPVEPSASGEIVVTTFNKGYPLIRFGTGDLGALAPQADANCPGQQRLLGLFGRSGDAVKVRGMFLHPNQLLAVKSRVPQIKHLRAVITRENNRDVITAQVELSPEYAGADVSEPVIAVVSAVSRLRVDVVEVVPAGTIDPAQQAIKDERKWD